MDIFELLDNKFDLCKQVDDLHMMIFGEPVFRNYHNSCTFAKVFNDEFFRSWKYSKGRLSIEDLLIDVNLYNESEDWPVKIHQEKQAFLFLQFYLNMYIYARTHSASLSKYTLNPRNFFEEIDKKCSYILDKSGMKTIMHSNEDYLLIVSNDEKLRTVAESVDKDTALLLYEYSTPLIKGNISAKRKILKLLANKYEAVIAANSKKYQAGLGKDIFGDLSFCLNNFEIRHSNLDPHSNKYNHLLINYKKDDFEEIYDTTYQLMLDASLIDNYSDKLSKTIERHKKAISSTK